MKWWWIPVGLVVLLGFVRLVLPSQLDDVNPLMGCSEEELELGDVYFVVPKFEGVEIDAEWCDYILGKDKEIAMHGVYHTYAEFGVVRSEVSLNEGLDIFRECFGFDAERFKPGNLKWNSGNDWIGDMVEVDLRWNQIFHKVYHCGDSGDFPNWFIRMF
jgi:hypothetical protein